jgi:hypothetical protein
MHPMSLCIPQNIASKIKNSIDAGELSTLSTGERKKVLNKIFTEANQTARAGKLSTAELSDLLTKFNKGFEERIVTSSRDLNARILRQKEIISDSNSSKAAVSRAKTTLADLTGTQEKLLAKQKELLNNYLKRELNRIPKPAQKPTFQKVQELKYLLDPSEKQLFLEDLVAHKFGFGVSNEVKDTLLKLATDGSDAQTALRRSWDDISAKAVDVFKKRPDIIARREEINKMPSGEAKKELSDALELESRHFAEDVFNGVSDINGMPLSKVEARKIQSERIRQGVKTQRLIEFIGALDRYTEKIKVSDVKAAQGLMEKYPLMLKMFGQNALEVTGSLKGVVASIDVSLLLRQGWHLILTNPRVWQKGVGTSIGESFDLAWRGNRKLRNDVEAAGLLNEFKLLDLTNTHHLEVRAEIATRANALNGKYQASSNNYMLDVLKEESFPVSLPSKVPVAGRAFAASEHFFNAQSLRWRANLADEFIRNAERKGVDVFDRKVADELGLVVGAMTGRGLPFGARFLEGNAEGFQKVMNYTFFSPRFVGSRFYTYRAIPDLFFDPTNYSKQVGARFAAQSVLTDLGLMLTAHTIAQTIWGDKAGIDFRPESGTFGHMRVGNFGYDVTGGHQTFVTLAGKIMLNRDGMRYNSKLGIYEPVPFSQTAVNSLIEFYTNKTSPAGSAIKDLINGHAFGGEKLSASDFTYNLLVPLSIQQPIEAWATGDFSDGLLVAIAEALGVTSKDYRIKPLSKEWKAVKDRSEKDYNNAVREFNKLLFPEIDRLRNDKKFQALEKEEQDKEIKSVSNRINKATIGKYAE